jgi:thiol-disulfide isomerase/thioredoxin
MLVMKKTKLKHIIFFLAAVVICGALALALIKASPKIILFYGDTCPHCEKVEEYINNNGLENKVSFRRLEVFSNQANANLLGEKASACGIKTDTVGVPFLYDGSQCYIGDEEVMNFFKQYE